MNDTLIHASYKKIIKETYNIKHVHLKEMGEVL